MAAILVYTSQFQAIIKRGLNLMSRYTGMAHVDPVFICLLSVM